MTQPFELQNANISIAEDAVAIPIYKDENDWNTD